MAISGEQGTGEDGHLDVLVSFAADPEGELADEQGDGEAVVLGLMRKGRGMTAKYHDESLADDVSALLAELEGGQFARDSTRPDSADLP